MSEVSKSRLYTAVMGITPKPPKPKGKNEAKQKKFQIIEDSDAADFFKVLRGGGTSLDYGQSQEESFAVTLLNGLNKDEMDALHKKILQISQATLNDKVQLKEMQKFCKETQNAIEAKMLESEQMEIKIQNEVEKRMKNISDFEEIEDTIEKNFSDLISEYTEYVNAGKIIPPNDVKTGKDYIRKVTRKNLP